MADSRLEDVSDRRKSEVWSHFLSNRAQETAECNLCSVILKAGGSSTKSLIKHLKSMHRIYVKIYYEAVSEDAKLKSKVVRIKGYLRMRRSPSAKS